MNEAEEVNPPHADAASSAVYLHAMQHVADAYRAAGAREQQTAEMHQRETRMLIEQHRCEVDALRAGHDRAVQALIEQHRHEIARVEQGVMAAFTESMTRLTELVRQELARREVA